MKKNKDTDAKLIENRKLEVLKKLQEFLAKEEAIIKAVLVTTLDSIRADAVVVLKEELEAAKKKSENVYDKPTE